MSSWSRWGCVGAGPPALRAASARAGVHACADQPPPAHQQLGGQRPRWQGAPLELSAAANGWRPVGRALQTQDVRAVPLLWQRQLERLGAGQQHQGPAGRPEQRLVCQRRRHCHLDPAPPAAQRRARQPVLHGKRPQGMQAAGWQLPALVPVHRWLPATPQSDQPGLQASCGASACSSSRGRSCWRMLQMGSGGADAHAVLASSMLHTCDAAAAVAFAKCGQAAKRVSALRALQFVGRAGVSSHWTQRPLASSCPCGRGGRRSLRPTRCGRHHELL